MLTDFLSSHLDLPFDSFESTGIYAREFQNDFLQKVENNKLFIPQNGKIGMPIKNAIEKYKNEINSSRSEEFASVSNNTPDGLLVWNGIYERIASQYHLLENSNELHSQPMLSLDAHWHYYTLCTNMFQGNLMEANLLKPQTVTTLKSLTEQRFDWLGNVPIEALVTLRENNENEVFRKKISGFVAELHESTLDDIDRVSSEVGRGIASLLIENRKKTQEIETKYKKLYQRTAIASWVSVGALFVPALAPFAAVSLGLAGKYAWDKLNETQEREKVSYSLMGVLASAKD